MTSAVEIRETEIKKIKSFKFDKTYDLALPTTNLILSITDIISKVSFVIKDLCLMKL